MELYDQQRLGDSDKIPQSLDFLLKRLSVPVQSSLLPARAYCVGTLKYIMCVRPSVVRRPSCVRKFDDSCRTLF